MANAAQVIQVKVGTGEPSELALNAGTVVDPTSIGRAGMWRVDGPGVLDVHGYIYFDGKSLFVQSADDSQPLMVNKHRVATAWTEVRAPSTIEVGRAELVYRQESSVEFDDGEATVARAVPGVPGATKRHDSPPARPAAPPAAPAPIPSHAAGPGGNGAAAPRFKPGGGAFANRADDESTRFAPIDAGSPAEAPRPNAGLSATVQSPGSGPNANANANANKEMTRIEPLMGAPMGGMQPGMGAPRPAAGAPAGSFPMPMGSSPHPGGMQGMQGMQQPMQPMQQPMMAMGGMQQQPGGMGMQPGMGPPGMMQPGMGMQGMPPGMQPGMGMMPGMQPVGMGMPGSSGMMPMGGMPGSGMPGMGMPGMGGPGMPGQTTSPPATNLGFLEKAKADWNAFPPTRKAALALAPFALVAALFVIFDPEEQPTPNGNNNKTGTSATAGSSPTSNVTVQAAAGNGVSGVGTAANNPMNGVSGVGTAANNPMNGVGAGQQGVVGNNGTNGSANNANNPNTGSAGQSPTPDGLIPSTAPMPQSSAKPTKDSKDSKDSKDAKDSKDSKDAKDAKDSKDPKEEALPPGKKTVERAAADAWAEGNFEVAAKMYDDLATQQPGNPAYREAARILRSAGH